MKRLAQQLLENHMDLKEVVFVGLQPRGIYVSELMMKYVKELSGTPDVNYGLLDITFYRDDFRKGIIIGSKTKIDCSIEDKAVVLIDDVLYTGRTIRAALDALMDFGRPKKVELCVLVDRRFNRELPIQPDYYGKAIDSVISQRVKVEWDKEQVVLY
jgi:pyrimidine operon attenuation protein/uracil phosphoribosyltransferase